MESLPMSHRHRPSGFTLFEMLMVVILLGLVSLIAFRPLDGLRPKTRLEAAARDLATTIRNAREQAILTSSHSGLRFDIDKGEYWIVLGDPEGRGRSFFVESSDGLQEFGRQALTRQRLPEGVDFQDLQFTEGSLYSSGLVGIEITPLGVFSEFLVHLRNEKETALTVHLNGIIGITEFYEGYEVPAHSMSQYEIPSF